MRRKKVQHVDPEQIDPELVPILERGAKKKGVTYLEYIRWLSGDKQLVYPHGFPNGIEIQKFKRFLEEEAEKTNVTFDVMVAALYEGEMIDSHIWELLGS